MIPFRVSVDLHTYFSDHRSLSYILVDGRFKNVIDLEDHIKDTFGLSVKRICLVSNNHILPPMEGICILNKDDQICVSTITENYFCKTRPCIRAEICSPHVRKRKISFHRSSPPTPQRSPKRSSIGSKSYDSKCKKKKPKPVICDRLAFEIISPKTSRESSPRRKCIIPSSTKLVCKKPETKKSDSGQKCDYVSNSRKQHNNHTVTDNDIQILNVENITDKEFSDINKDSMGEILQLFKTNSNVPNDNSTIFINSFARSPNVNSNKTAVDESEQETTAPVVKSPVITKSLENKSTRISKRLPQFTVGNFLSFAQELENSQVPNASEPAVKFVTPANIMKRRKRIRRKKVKLEDDSTSITSQSDVEAFIAPKTCANPISHIRFDETPNDNIRGEVVNEKSELLQCSTSTPQDSFANVPHPCTPELVPPKALISNENSSEVIHLSSFSECVLRPPSARRLFEEAVKLIDVTKPDITDFKHTLMIKEIGPKVNDIIAFKLYEMSPSYEPHISDWIVGNVAKYYSNTKEVDLNILAGKVQTHVPPGKFDMSDFDDANISSCETVVHLNFMDLIDPTLLLPSF